MLQLISAGLQWFLDGVYIRMPTVSDQRLNITVRLRDTSSALLTTGNYTFVQVSHAEVSHASVACLREKAPPRLCKASHASNIVSHTLFAQSSQ